MLMHLLYQGFFIMRIAAVLMMVAVLAPAAGAQTALPPRYADLPKLAASWPPAWGALVQAIVPPRDDFEKDVLARVAELLKAEPAASQTYRCADIVLAATLRHHLSVRQPAPLADNPWHATQTELQDRLLNLRKDWLEHLSEKNENVEALRLAEQWLPTALRGNPLRAAILHLWVQQAKTALQKNEYAAARAWLDRIDANFTTAKQADEIRQSLRVRAETLRQEAQTLPDPAAILVLQEALALWPRLPEGRDSLLRRKEKFQTLRVAVRSLPEQLSPATAWTEVERQTLDLLFDRLYEVEYRPGLGKRYHPQLTAEQPDGSSIQLRRDAHWSSGERLTAADVRHTALLSSQSGHAALWRDFLEIPRLEGPAFHLNLGYRQALFDPLAPLDFRVLPQYYRGKQLDQADDPDFAKAPVGSGPFQYVGRQIDAGKPTAVFQANPHDLRRELGSLREIRLAVWSDARQDLGKPLPHLALDVPTDQLQAFKDLGYTEIKTANAPPRVHFLAVNQRRPTLASPLVRRAIAHALDRQTLLDRHFRSDALKGKYHATARGPFPRESWASCPAPACAGRTVSTGAGRNRLPAR